MADWNRQDEALYRELERRAQEQARALYAQRKPDLPPPTPTPSQESSASQQEPSPGQNEEKIALAPPPPAENRAEASPPPAQQNSGPSSHPRPRPHPGTTGYSGAAGRPLLFSRSSSSQGTSPQGARRGLDKETLLLGLLLYIMVREKADKELIFALVYILCF